jgi:hypothetical protein
MRNIVQAPLEEESSFCEQKEAKKLYPFAFGRLQRRGELTIILTMQPRATPLSPAETGPAGGFRAPMNPVIAFLLALIDAELFRIIQIIERMYALWREGKLPPPPERAPRQTPARQAPRTRAARPRAPRIRLAPAQRAPVSEPTREPAAPRRAPTPSPHPVAPGIPTPPPRPHAGLPPPLRFQNAACAALLVTP